MKCSWVWRWLFRDRVCEYWASRAIYFWIIMWFSHTVRQITSPSALLLLLSVILSIWRTQFLSLCWLVQRPSSSMCVHMHMPTLLLLWIFLLAFRCSQNPEQSLICFTKQRQLTCWGTWREVNIFSLGSKNNVPTLLDQRNLLYLSSFSSLHFLVFA